MKVSELMEQSWDNQSPDPKTYLRLLRKKLNSIHDQQMVVNDTAERLMAGHEHLPNSEKHKFYVAAEQRSKQLTLLRNKVEAEIAKAKLHMKHVVHDAELAYRHAKSVRNGEFPEGEDAMATDPKVAYDYAVNVLGKRFLKGEPAIVTVPELKNGYRQRFGTINYEYPPNESK